MATSRSSCTVAREVDHPHAATTELAAGVKYQRHSTALVDWCTPYVTIVPPAVLSRFKSRMSTRARLCSRAAEQLGRGVGMGWSPRARRAAGSRRRHQGPPGPHLPATADGAASVSCARRARPAGLSHPHIVRSTASARPAALLLRHDLRGGRDARRADSARAVLFRRPTRRASCAKWPGRWPTHGTRHRASRREADNILLEAGTGRALVTDFASPTAAPIPAP